MKLALLIFIVSLSSLAQVCNDEKIGTPECLGLETSKSDLDLDLATRVDAEAFCKKCNNPILNKVLDDKDAIEKRESDFGKAVLDEFQKEITYISADLMKMRSSFKLDFDPKRAIASCNFKKNLAKPKCLTKEQSKVFDEQSQAIQNSLASEISNMLSPSNSNEGLLTRRPNSCEIDDKSATIVQTRYQESLITSEFLKTIDALQIPKDMSLNDYFKDKNDSTAKTVSTLKLHPLFKSLINDPKKFNSFLLDNKNESDQKNIINSLYTQKNATNFANDIRSRCDQVFTKTSKYLEEVFCKDDPAYVADNLDTMESVLGKSFSLMSTNQEAENNLKTYCAYLNKSESKSSSFSVIKKDINGSNDPRIVTATLDQFKKTAYVQIVGDSNEICDAIKTNECKSTSTESKCIILGIYKELKSSPIHQALAKSSSDEINLILRSMIGDAIPQKDGKPDQQAILALKFEGILPGGENTARPPQQDAGSFHRAVANTSNSRKPPTSHESKAPSPTSTVQPSPTAQSTTSLGSEEQNDSLFDSQTAATRNKTDSGKIKNSFDALSDNEQMNILNRMKPKSNGKKPARNSKTAISNDNDDSYSTPGPNFDSGSFTMNQAAVAADNTAVEKPATPQSEAYSGTRAKLDPKKIDKEASFNEAKIQASQNRAPASDITRDTIISLSKTDGGLNKIEIKVPDESVLAKKTPELETKIQDYLDKSGQSLQGAKKGEAFIVKLGKYDIKVSINDYGVYVATCKDKSIHPDYLAFLSRYFTGIKERVSSSEAMKKVLIESTSSK